MPDVEAARATTNTVGNMKFNPLHWPRYFVWVFLLALLLGGCAGEVTEHDCRQIRQEITAFTEKNILPLVDSESPPKIERSIVAQLKRLRGHVTTCALSDVPDDATEWNEDNLIRLDGRLAFFEVTLEQAAEAENPEITRMLVNSRNFGEAVLDLQAALGIEDQQ